MSWIIALVCLLVGAAAGALLFKHFKSDEARVQLLEAKLQQLTDEHESYKREVHGHFSDSAHLLAKLTESYRDVYQHLAEGARNLCPDYIANQVTQITAAPLALDTDHGLASNDTRIQPPLDYAVPATEGKPAATGTTGSTDLPGRS